MTHAIIAAVTGQRWMPQMLRSREAMPVRKPIALQYAQRSDRGRVRRSNDDISVAEELSLPDGRCLVLAAIADGIGSSRAGADASHLAVSTALDYLRTGLRQPPRDERHWSTLLIG